MSKPLVCCFDCSDVLIHLGRAKAEHAKNMFGVDCCPQHFKRKFIVGKHGLLTEEQYDEIQRVVYDPEHMLSLNAVPGAVECIEDIARAGHRVCIVTSRTGEKLEVIKKWWRRKSPLEIEFFGTGQGQSKGPTLKRLKADTFVDNDRKKLRLIAEEGIRTKLFLLSWCSNTHHHLPKPLRRLGSFTQFREELALMGNF
ncbi:MAG TPA: hypothetical protein VN420_02940 [Candidatus Fimivivens sp.]|nr:hypothetical protein [Candidatus Fimivivens sp.]